MQKESADSSLGPGNRQKLRGKSNKIEQGVEMGTTEKSGGSKQKKRKPMGN
jgi:hypothetical protein